MHFGLVVDSKAGAVVQWCSDMHPLLPLGHGHKGFTTWYAHCIDKCTKTGDEFEHCLSKGLSTVLTVFRAV